MSGLSFTRITYPDFYGNKECSSLVDDFFGAANTSFENHRFSVLFNAYTEKTYGAIIQENYRKNLHNVHADSGGLQIITQGKTVTPAIQDDIYKVQAQYSDIGMCFDEIPLKTTGSKSKRGDTSNRFFDRDNLKEYAKKTGINVKRQIEVYLEGKSSCMPFLIVHGNDVETALTWTDTLLEQIPYDQHKYIGGIAMGGGSFGNGEKEALLRAVIAGHILSTRDDIVHKQIHFLGLGSLKNAFSFISMMKSGMYKPDWHISYDSTTHSSGHHFGQYIDKNGKSIGITRSYTYDYQRILNDIRSNVVPDYPDVSTDEFFQILNMSYGQFTELKTMEPKKFLWANMACCMSSATNFMRKIDQYVDNFDSFLEEQIDSKRQSLYMSIANIKTLDDFYKWDKNVGRYLPSKKIGDQASNMLEFD